MVMMLIVKSLQPKGHNDQWRAAQGYSIDFEGGAKYNPQSFLLNTFPISSDLKVGGENRLKSGPDKFPNPVRGRPVQVPLELPVLQELASLNVHLEK